jgi:hypothetical protein
MEKTQDVGFEMETRLSFVVAWRCCFNPGSGFFTDVLLCMPTIYNAMLLALGAFDIYN